MTEPERDHGQVDAVMHQHVLKELPQRAPDADVADLLPFNYAREQAVTNSG
ncbi:hypothetical protein [Paraburkholderia tropica]|uniref:hypothetical protein n=1 Tax=Paraburkholderia tropica TaxID=92647 RepID=UPI002AB67C4A|nr:hypothetical protein [Paraburkholderia tropica]